jgi:hypothetical protein
LYPRDRKWLDRTGSSCSCVVENAQWPWLWSSREKSQARLISWASSEAISPDGFLTWHTSYWLSCVLSTACTDLTGTCLYKTVKELTLSQEAGPTCSFCFCIVWKTLLPDKGSKALF